MGRRSTKITDTRTRLLDTAGQLFRVQGFHATGLDEVLRQSGTPKGSLYHYFPGGKEQLAIETIRYVAPQMEQQMSEPLASSDDPLKGLRTLLDSIIKNSAESDFRFGCPIAAVVLDVACDRSAVREACERGFETLVTMFTQHFKRAGLSEKRATSLATLFFAALEGALILSRAQKSVAPLKAIATELIQVAKASLASHASDDM